MRPLFRTRLLLVLGILWFVTWDASAQVNPDQAKQIAEIEKQIADLQKKIADLKTPTAKKTLSLNDAALWRGIRAASLSQDGTWFAARVGTLEGESEIVLRNIKTDKETKYAGGASMSGLSASPVGFSADSKWLAFAVMPPRSGSPFGPRPIPKVVLVNLTTSEKMELEGYRSFAFNGDLATHVALRKAPIDAAPTGAPMGQPMPKGPIMPTPAPSTAGDDLIVRELATGLEFAYGNVNEFAFNKQGTWLALVLEATGDLGNGVQLREMKTGAIFPLDTGKAKYKNPVWHEKGEALAILKGLDEKGIEGKFYSVLGFTDLGPKTVKTMYNPILDPTFPKEMGIATTRAAFWNDDLSALVFGIAEQKRVTEPKKDAPKKDGPPTTPPARPTTGGAKPDMVIWHWKDERLQSQQQVQAAVDKAFNYLCLYRVKEKKFLRLADDTVRNVNLAPKHQFAIGVDTKPYQLMSTLDGRRYSDVYVINTTTGERKKALTKVRFNAGASPDGTHWLYHDDGHFRTMELATLKTFNVTEKIPTKFYDDEDDHNIDKPPTGVVAWTEDGKTMLLNDNWDIWQVGVHGENAVNLTVDGRTKGIRYADRVSFDPQEKGINLTKSQVFTMYGEWTKKSGYALWTPNKTGVVPLVWDDAEIGNLAKAKNADTYMYVRQTALQSPDAYVTVDPMLKNAKKVTDTNPQQANYQWMSGAKLIEYVGLNGKKLQAALYLPANYQPGKKYPTVVYIYEKLSQEIHRYQGPTIGGFNKSLYTSNGYAVLMPDITYQLNDPGISAVKCILPALDAAIASGVVDDARVGLHGHSWGGYQTAFLITQTDRFKAAIAGAPLTNLVSMYSSIYWNSGSANQPIFESSQGRFTGGYFDLQEAYIRNSPVFHAKRVQTPLVLLHNDKDGAVDWTQGIEYFNTLRRLQKPVVMLQYKGENHGLVKPENRRDYAIRMREFFDHHLMGKPAPDWWKEGVPHLKLDEHLQTRPKE